MREALEATRRPEAGLETDVDANGCIALEADRDEAFIFFDNSRRCPLDNLGPAFECGPRRTEGGNSGFVVMV
jgi:hypothetical protein